MHYLGLGMHSNHIWPEKMGELLILNLYTIYLFVFLLSFESYAYVGEWIIIIIMINNSKGNTHAHTRTAPEYYYVQAGALSFHLDNTVEKTGTERKIFFLQIFIKSTILVNASSRLLLHKTPFINSKTGDCMHEHTWKSSMISHVSCLIPILIPTVLADQQYLKRYTIRTSIAIQRD